jgi:hypothetical protein
VSRIADPVAARRYGGLLPAAAHGLSDPDLSGHLTADKWNADAEDLIDTAIGLLPGTS